MTDFKPNDRVFHRWMGEYGTVTSVSKNGTVSVTYDNPGVRGEYDRRWFEIHDDALVVTGDGEAATKENDNG